MKKRKKEIHKQRANKGGSDKAASFLLSWIQFCPEMLEIR